MPNLARAHTCMYVQYVQSIFHPHISNGNCTTRDYILEIHFYLGMCVAPENVLTGTSLCFLHILHVSVSVWAPLGRHLAVVSLRIWWSLLQFLFVSPFENHEGAHVLPCILFVLSFSPDLCVLTTNIISKSYQFDDLQNFPTAADTLI